MALLHRAQLRPTKIELLEQWAPTQPWSAGQSGFEVVASYRFDDPAGEVGIEGIVMCSRAGTSLHVPVTYRGAPLADGEAALIGTMEHSALGRRWVYDAAGDPVAFAAFATAIVTGGREAEQYVEVEGELVSRESTAWVRGTGASEVSVPVSSELRLQHGVGASVIEASSLRLYIVRLLDVPSPELPDAAMALMATWLGRSESRPIAVLSS